MSKAYLLPGQNRSKITLKKTWNRLIIRDHFNIKLAFQPNQHLNPLLEHGSPENLE
jgi:hypothetical protein